jgi:hypothetical protein
MSESKHTPGPWRAAIRANQKGPNGVSVDLPMAMGSWRPYRRGDDKTNTMDAANAHLIAAAPDLLEALRMMAAEVSQTARPDGPLDPQFACPSMTSAFAFAQDVIARAEGRS